MMVVAGIPVRKCVGFKLWLKKEIMPTSYDEFRNADLPQLLSQLAASSTGSVQGTDRIYFFQNMIAVRIAEMVNKQLAATAETVGKSANTIKETLDHSTSLAKAVAENAADFLISSIRVSIETGTKNAEAIKAQIEGLGANIALAGADLRNASTQSSRLSARLNWLTAVLAGCGLLTAGATGFQAYETKRQVDLVAKQTVVQGVPKATSNVEPAANAQPPKQ